MKCWMWDFFIGVFCVLSNSLKMYLLYPYTIVGSERCPRITNVTLSGLYIIYKYILIMTWYCLKYKIFRNISCIIRSLSKYKVGTCFVNIRTQSQGDLSYSQWAPLSASPAPSSNCHLHLNKQLICYIFYNLPVLSSSAFVSVTSDASLIFVPLIIFIHGWNFKLNQDK